MSGTPTRPTCATCPYWHSLDDGEGWGYCRKYAPRPITYTTDHHGDAIIPLADWRQTMDSEWCGEHPDFALYLEALKRERMAAAARKA